MPTAAGDGRQDVLASESSLLGERPAGNWLRSREMAVLLIVLGLGLIALARAAQATSRNVVLLTSPGVVSSQLQETKRYACLEALMRKALPLGSDVVDLGTAGLEYQRIAEELTPGYHFVATAHPGAYTVSFTTSGPCDGRGVVVRTVER